MHTIFAARELGLDEEEENQLRQGQGNHGEIDALPTNRQQGKAGAQNRGRQGAGDGPHLRGKPGVIAEQVTGGIATRGQEGRMTE